jgi:dTDP-4-dehydrorhamnose 3,5-epimerase
MRVVMVDTHSRIVSGSLTLVFDDHKQQTIQIPADRYHGFTLVGSEPAILLSFLTKLYDYEGPDEERLPPDIDTILLDRNGQSHFGRIKISS